MLLYWMIDCSLLLKTGCFMCFCKQKTAYEMRISDWSSDVCSSDLRAAFFSGLALHYRRAGDLERSIRTGFESLALYQTADAEREEAALENNLEIGRASCRERGCQYV